MPLTTVWFIGVPGPNAVVDLWQVAQSPVTGMCPVPCGFGVTPVNAIPVALAAWHVVQPLAIPAWFMVVPAKLAKLPTAWQLSQLAVVGTWFVGLVLMVTPV